jgi:hypothetical protein
VAILKDPMDFKNLTKKEIISCHLNLLQKYDDETTIFSSLTAALRDARQNTGRDLVTGILTNKDDEHKLANWSGAMCYLIILDQLGKCYKPKGFPDYTEKNSIQRCLKYYTHLSDEEIDAIYALRNALLHDYSISNCNSKRPSLQHHFTLLGFRLPNLMGLPTKIWDGNIETKSKENVTYISLPTFGDMVESIWNSTLNLHRHNDLVVILKGGVSEIRTRYLQYIFNDQNGH